MNNHQSDNHHNGNTAVSIKTNDYYTAGSKDLAMDSPLTLHRLETRRKLTKDSTLLVIVLVGLPARGKSFVARKLHHFLQWSGSQCKIFNVGKYRRQAFAAISKNSTNPNLQSCDADFFDGKNKEAALLREKVAEVALSEMLRWLDAEESDDSEENQPLRHYQPNSSQSVSSSTVQRTGTDAWAHDRVAIFDATNSTAERRKWILEECTSPIKRRGKRTGVVFVESICDDLELLEENYRFKVDNSPDFKDVPREEALADLRRRVQKYQERYESITDDSLSYIKIFNLSSKLMVNHIYGRMAKTILPALMAWHIGTRPVYLCRPGQTPSGITMDSEDYVSSVDQRELVNLSFHGKKRMMRGNKLGPKGIEFSKRLLEFITREGFEFANRRASTMEKTNTGTSITGLAPLYEENSNVDQCPVRILASTMPRTRETVEWEGKLESHIEQLSGLNPLDKGDFAGMELEELQFSNSSWYEKLEQDPFHTRFPGGECYRDLINRLNPVLIDIEQQVVPMLVVSHVSVLQCLMAYFRNSPVEKCMSIEVPLHTVIKFTPVRGGGWSESQHPLFEEPEAALCSGIPKVSSESSFHNCNSSNNMDVSFSSPYSPPPIWGDHMLYRNMSSLYLDPSDEFQKESMLSKQSMVSH